MATHPGPEFEQFRDLPDGLARAVPTPPDVHWGRYRAELLAELCAVTAPVDVRRCGHCAREPVGEVAELLELRPGVCGHVRSSPSPSWVLLPRGGRSPAPSPRS